MRLVRGTVFVALTLVGSLVLASPAYAQNGAFNFGLSQQKPAPPPPARPQQNTDNGIGIGVLGGIGITSFRGDAADTEGTSSGTGWMFGIWFGGNVNGAVGFMGEVSYVDKRISIDDTGVDGDYLSTKYLEIPALIRINIGSRMRQGARVYGLVGPVFDFRLSSKLHIFGEDVPEADLENQFSSVDIGLMAGGGVEWNRLGFEVRGNWGMKQLATDEAIESGSVPSVKSTSIQILGKFRFN
jgi:hypothetical protein